MRTSPQHSIQQNGESFFPPPELPKDRVVLENDERTYEGLRTQWNMDRGTDS